MKREEKKHENVELVCVVCNRRYINRKKTYKIKTEKKHIEKKKVAYLKREESMRRKKKIWKGGH